MSAFTAVVGEAELYFRKRKGKTMATKSDLLTSAEFAKKAGITYLPGIELSTKHVEISALMFAGYIQLCKVMLFCKSVLKNQSMKSLASVS